MKEEKMLRRLLGPVAVALAVAAQVELIRGDAFMFWPSLGAVGVQFVIFELIGWLLRNRDAAAAREIRILSGASFAAAVLQSAGRLVPAAGSIGAWLLLGVSLGLPPVMLGIGLLLEKREEKKWNDRSVAQTQALLQRSREEDRKLMEGMRTLRRRSAVWAAVLGLSGAGGAFLSGMMLRAETVCFLYTVVVLTAAFVRIHLPWKQEEMEGDTVPRQAYPVLYALAEKARDALECRGEVRIALSPDCNAGLWHGEDGTVLNIGVTLLDIATEEELYAVMLHEFGHAAADTPEDRRARRHHHNILEISSGPVSDLLEMGFYGCFDHRYLLLWDLYKMAVSVRQEYNADRAMVRFGDPRAAGSVLLKLSCHDFYEWEMGEEPLLFAGETPPAHVLGDQIACFRSALSRRSAQWTKMAQNQIQGRSDTHPTLRARLDAMGIREAVLYDSPSSQGYRREQKQALEQLDREIFQQMQEGYEEVRRKEYLKPLGLVADWEKAGQPVDPETVTDVIEALGLLGRFREEEALCDRVIGTLPPAGSHDALYIRGCLRLHRYDPGGLEDLYQAIEANSNHIEEGLWEIGRFCCITGRQEELETYRARALELAQDSKDLYSRMGDLKHGGTLVPEQLPRQLQERLLACIRGVDDGCLERVYLVRNQITEDFFASAVILKFAKDAPQAARETVSHRVFRFLDNTTDWQFTLHEYEEIDHPESLHLDRIPGSCIYEGNREE